MKKTLMALALTLVAGGMLACGGETNTNNANNVNRNTAPPANTNMATTNTAPMNTNAAPMNTNAMNKNETMNKNEMKKPEETKKPENKKP